MADLTAQLPPGLEIDDEAHNDRMGRRLTAVLRQLNRRIEDYYDLEAQMASERHSAAAIRDADLSRASREVVRMQEELKTARRETLTAHQETLSAHHETLVAQQEADTARREYRALCDTKTFRLSRAPRSAYGYLLRLTADDGARRNIGSH